MLLLAFKKHQAGILTRAIVQDRLPFPSLIAVSLGSFFISLGQRPSLPSALTTAIGPAQITSFFATHSPAYWSLWPRWGLICYWDLGASHPQVRTPVLAQSVHWKTWTKGRNIWSFCQQSFRGSVSFKISFGSYLTWFYCFYWFKTFDFSFFGQFGLEGVPWGCCNLTCWKKN